MPSPVNPIHTNANALNGGAKNEVKDAKNAPKSASKDFSKILNQKISKDKTAPKESPNPNALKATPKDAKEDAKALEKTLPHQHAQNPAKNQQAPTLKDWLNPKTTAPHEAQHEKNHETNPKTPNETLNKNEKKPNEVTSNAHQTNLPNKNPITPTNHANNAIKTPTAPTHNAKDPKTLKDIQTISQKHDLNANNIQASTTPENKTPLNASDHLALKTTQTPINHTLAKNDAKNTANLSSVLQSLEKKESHNKEHANPPNNEKKTPPLKEALQMNAIKRDKTLSKKKSEKTPIHAKTQTTAQATTPENAPKIPLKTPPLMPLIGANPPNDNAPTLLEKEETTKEASDNKEKAKETNSSAQSAQNTQASDKTSENKSIAPKETIKHFTQQLKQEIQEYKPPMSKISMDLFPKELGKVEVIIQKVGKNLKVSVISHNNSLQTFLDNQQDLKNSLNALGFEGVDLSFSQDSSKEQQAPKDQPKEPFKEQELTPLKENALKSYQENTDNEHKETSMQITLYA
ncbi:flagellar hook-length control protein FliK [Helicobacter pylori]|uniref:flagellar hook-length control protein FliK n=1 Tax=Helicobacter pylori TaxID=210 RepID=UPI00165AB8B6|nr:flagellar hook-length control protein FliK [Helicobacter pylori]